MKVAIALLLCLVAVASAGVIAPVTTLVRTPSLDSAVIQSDRLGGNFAYSSVEGHAYAAITPVVQNVVQPVGVSYTAHQVPVGVAISQPAVVAAAPAIAPAPAVVAGPVPAPVAAPIAAPALFPSLISSYPVAVAGPAAPVPAAPAPAADAPASAPAPAPAPAADLASGDSVSVESA